MSPVLAMAPVHFAGGDRVPVRAGRGMAFAFAEALYGPVVEGEIDLARGPARLSRRKPESGEQLLGHPMVPFVLPEAGVAPGRQPALPPTPCHQTEPLERREVLERRGGPQFQLGSDRPEGGPAGRRLELPHGHQGVELATAQPRENLHALAMRGPLLKDIPNF